MNRYAFQPKLVPTLAALAGCAILVCLGFWQLSRIIFALVNGIPILLPGRQQHGIVCLLGKRLAADHGNG